MSLRVHFIQHAGGEGPGGVAEWAAARGHDLRGSHPYRGDPFPAPDDLDLLVVLGGGMNVHQTDRYPWLDDERALIAAAIARGTPVLGICLGSQLLAEVLGGSVARAEQPEIGWFPVEATPEGERFGLPACMDGFHWHEDTWSLPAGAVRLAGSAACANQAFAHGDRLVGIQFHPEMTLDIARSIIAAEGDALPAGRHVQSTGEMLARPERFAAAHAVLWTVLDRLAERATP